MTRLYANNVSTTLLNSITEGATALTVVSAVGLPTLSTGDVYRLTLSNGVNTEIVEVSAANGADLTVSRTQESTSARSWIAGDVVELRATAATHSAVAARVDALEEVRHHSGSVFYDDTATDALQISVPADTWADLTNNAAGPFTNTDFMPDGVTSIWDVPTQRFDWSQLEPGDTVTITPDIIVTTTSQNQMVSVRTVMSEGVNEYTIAGYHAQFKTPNGQPINAPMTATLWGEAVRDNPAVIQVKSDDPCTVQVRGWYCRIIRYTQ
ncbi:MAG: hypothetical protein ACPGF7_09575 [Pontibacterium sp.]